ncbi:DUF1684 domain-containing protein [Xanthomonas melonis]|uniref:DUF1684 domain-containing protein n=1 Tax=Xanthomonas melonis TaxID=56456 RepID=UPI001E50801C|nr:DUF1684 domain-containing protein [Xanthomonas melonis]MCD0280367.1 DUF1684 domain-containing protein [Xanthomonas melonis]
MWLQWRACLVGVALCSMAACSAGSTAEADGTPEDRLGDAQSSYQLTLAHARAQRLARLRAPEGWLSFIGSGRVQVGRHRVGSDADSDIVLPVGPAQLGQLTLDAQGHARFEVAQGAAVTVNGQPVQVAELRPERAGQRGDRLEMEGRQFFLVQTGHAFGWRLRDPAAPGLSQFEGLEYFPTDPRWRVRAHWQAYEPARTATLLTSIGTTLTVQVPGEAVFARDGRHYRLQPIAQDGGGLVFLFADRTSGKESYGGARYLVTALPHDGQVVLDFNLAENPPCAFTPHAVCPIAPLQNRLAVAVNAGETLYRPADP